MPLKYCCNLICIIECLNPFVYQLHLKADFQTHPTQIENNVFLIENPVLIGLLKICCVQNQLPFSFSV
jgi:hypothetical protein